MLRLEKITKDYVAGDSVVHALKGIDIEFRKSEFVAVLGPSGCGKTTLLNIIGGLDRYTAGRMSVAGRPTENFRDADWDAYRNHSIGFVFQSYNLIPHQTVLSNVELALTLSGVSKAERRRRAAAALERVGLGDQLTKKPNQMSGGQMQRVAIARALVNDPEILLADEPTGALDSENSVQIMEILKEIANDRLIIMVTHNPDLAEQYATRTVRLLDGQIISDSDPYTHKDGEAATSTEKATREKTKRTSMSFFTALALSCNNLLTKKTRTFLTSFAGSIGIIGIALILSLSQGISLYINQVQEDTLSSYPITLQAEAVDIGSLFQATSEKGEDWKPHTEEELATYVYANNMMYDFINSLNSMETTKNNLSAFKKYIETENQDGQLPLDSFASSIMYEYDVPLNVYVEDKDGGVVKADATSMMQSMMQGVTGGDSDALSGIFSPSSMSMSMMSGVNVWEELLPPDTTSGDYDGELVNPLLKDQYDLIYGSWPTAYNEVVLVVNSNNQVSDLVLYSLGLLTAQEMSDSFIAMEKGEEIHNDNGPWTFEEMCSRKLKLVISADKYALDGTTGRYLDLSATELGVKTLYERGVELKISGILRPNPDAVSGAISGSIGYTTALTSYIIDETAKRDIIKAQLADPETDVITGLPFPSEDAEEPTAEEIKAAVDAYLEALKDTPAERAAIYTAIMSIPTDEYVNAAVTQYMANLDRAALEEMIKTEYPEYAGMLGDISDETLLGYVRASIEKRVRDEYAAGVAQTLSSMSIEQLAAAFDAMKLTEDNYTLIYEKYVPAQESESTYDENVKALGIVDRDSPSAIYIYASTFANKDEIANVITAYNGTVEETDEITYTDYVALLMSSITTILNAITYVLIAFVAVSLVVSSIMIGIITYISVLERTKEIGILRSIGASKRDVSRVFNAETLIIGFASGMIGIIATLLLCIPINIIIRALTEINNIGAVLPWGGAVILVAISMGLTLIAGLIPARLAAKKDPVVALRTE